MSELSIYYYINLLHHVRINPRILNDIKNKFHSTIYIYVLTSGTTHADQNNAIS